MAKRASHRQIASIAYRQAVRIAQLRQANGVVSDAGAWLKAGANILSSGKAGWLGPRRGRQAPEWWGVSIATLWRFANDCHLDVTREQIEHQVAETKAWRAAMSEKLGRPHQHMMQMDRLGALLGVTDDERRDAKAWSIGTVGGSQEARKQAAVERNRLRRAAKRRDDGKTTRERVQMIDGSKPWEVEGVSRRTWFRNRERAADGDAVALSDATCNDTAKLALSDVALSDATCNDAVAPSDATSIDEGRNASSASRLEAIGSKIQTVKIAASIGLRGSEIQRSADHVAAFGWIEDALVISAKQGGLRVVVAS